MGGQSESGQSSQWMSAEASLRCLTEIIGEDLAMEGVISALGNCQISLRAEPFMRRAALGVMFKHADLLTIGRQHGGVIQAFEAEVSAKDHYEWGAVLDEMFRLIDTGEMAAKFGAIRGQRVMQSIANYIRPRVTNAKGENPSYETVRKVVRLKVFRRWLEHDLKR